MRLYIPQGNIQQLLSDTLKWMPVGRREEIRDKKEDKAIEKETDDANML